MGNCLQYNLAQACTEIQVQICSLERLTNGMNKSFALSTLIMIEPPFKSTQRHHGIPNNTILVLLLDERSLKLIPNVFF